jgi:hypothetical protein
MVWGLPNGGTANGNGPILQQDRVANSPAYSEAEELPRLGKLRHHDAATLDPMPSCVNLAAPSRRRLGLQAVPRPIICSNVR